MFDQQDLLTLTTAYLDCGICLQDAHEAAVLRYKHDTDQLVRLIRTHNYQASDTVKFLLWRLICFARPCKSYA